MNNEDEIRKSLAEQISRIEIPPAEKEVYVTVSFQKYNQLLVAVQDLLLEMDVTPEDLEQAAKGQYMREVLILSAKTAQKLLDAGVVPQQRSTQIQKV